MEYKIQNIGVNELTEETLYKYTKDGWEIISVVPKYETTQDYFDYTPVNYQESSTRRYEKTVLTNYSLILKK